MPPLPDAPRAIPVVSVTFAMLVCGALGHAQSPDFLAQERRAQAALAVLQCNSEAALAAAAGAFGPLDRGVDDVTCLDVATEPRGIAFRLGPPGARVGMPRLADLQRRTRVDVPFDTARFTQTIVAMIGAGGQAVAEDRDGRESLGIVLRGAADTIEVWYVPVTQVTDGRSWLPQSLGGERAVIVRPDGRQLVRVIDHGATWRPFAAKPTGMVLLRSAQDEVPTLTEMMACLQLTLTGRDAAIETRRWTYVRFGSGWVVTRR